MNVVAHRAEIGLALGINEYGLVPSLKEMTSLSMPGVVSNCISALDPLHSTGEVSL